jgi:hypothetical protein
LLIAGLIATAPAFALPPPAHDLQRLLPAGEPVASIPTANSIQGFEALDNEHVMVSTAGRQQYLVTLNRQCIGLRWAQHIGVSTSDNTIWAGFDAVTADGENCPIREIHRLPDTADETLN